MKTNGKKNTDLKHGDGERQPNDVIQPSFKKTAMGHLSASSFMNMSIDVMGDSAANLSKYRVEEENFKCSFLNRREFLNGSYAYLESEEERRTVTLLCESRTIVGKVLFWLTTILGIPGNLAAFLTLLSMAKTTGTLYIAILSILDLCSILFKMTSLIFRKNGVPIGDAGCKMMKMSTGFVVTYANWVLVLICVERFVTIRFPLKKVVYFTIRRARHVVIGLGFGLLPLSAVLLYTYEAAPRAPGFCRKRHDLGKFPKNWGMVAATFYSYIPAVLLFILVGLIILALRHHREKRRSILSHSEEEAPIRENGARALRHSSNQNRQISKIERNLTLMLLAASVVFLVLTLPICLLVFFNPYIERDEPVSYARYRLLTALARGMTFLSHAVNCYIYFLSCKRFRLHLFTGISDIWQKLLSACKLTEPAPRPTVASQGSNSSRCTA